MPLPLPHARHERSMTEAGFNIKLKEKYLFVDFYADWCEPCKILDRVLEEMQPAFEARMVFLKVDIDESEDLKKKYSIMSVPTLILFYNGNVIWRMPGFMYAKELGDTINKVISDSEAGIQNNL